MLQCKNSFTAIAGARMIGHWGTGADSGVDGVNNLADAVSRAGPSDGKDVNHD